MRKIIGYLLPWRPTFRRLELEKRWWHRLAVVLFFIALTLTFIPSWSLGDNANGPSNRYEQDIHHWGVLAGSSNGLLFDLDTEQLSDNASPVPLPPTVQKTIEMPDGKTATFPGTISDEAIKAEWTHKFNAMDTESVWFGLGIAVLVTVLFSYLLQSAYRALLYVIYGARIKAIPDISPIDEAN